MRPMTLSLTMLMLLSAFAVLAKDAEVFVNTQPRDDMRFKNLFPDTIKTIALVTPAYMPGADSVRNGISLLEKAGYTVKLGQHALDKPPKGSHRIPVDIRVSDFMAAWNDPSVDLIICTRGGGGTDELIEKLDWEAMKKRPDLPVVGYSDVTLLLCAMLSKNIGHPVTGPMVTSLVGCSDRSLQAMRESFGSGPTTPVKVTPLREGNVRGLAMGGLLDRYGRIAKTSFRPNTEGRVIFIESVGREVPSMRTYLNSLLEQGFFDKAAAVVFCAFTRMKSKEGLDAMLKDFTEKVTIPVYKGFPYGHQSQIHTIDYRRLAVIENGMLHFEQPTQPNLPAEK